MKLIINNLLIETTRRCNMSCAHCLRGKARNVDMTDQILANLFEDVEEVHELVFTGGEPFLNLKAIQETRRLMESNNVYFGGFFVATNAKQDNPSALQEMVEFYLYADDKESCSITVSRDDYHDDIPQKNVDRVKALSFYSTSHDEISGNRPHERSRYLLDVGNARLNQIGKKPSPVQYHDDPINIEVREPEGPTLWVEQLYVSANGNIVINCDQSYSMIDHRSLGNLRNEPLRNIILRAVNESELDLSQASGE